MTRPMYQKLILASSSPQRKRLLEQIGIEVTVVPPEISEVKREDVPIEEWICRLALAKAENVAQRFKSGVVLGADTVVVLDSKVFGKPKDNKEAEEMLRELSGTTHKVITGLALIDIEIKNTLVESVTTEVTLKGLSQAQIANYIITKEPLGKAGGLCVQGRGAQFIERIDGCYTNVIGLPLAKLTDMLERLTLQSYSPS
ncbi:TPA: septum formation inhibitor Maf [bacterium]|nr:septum formation inhibitor Maf [bacterium]